MQSSRGFFDDHPLSESVQQQFFANLHKIFAQMNQLQLRDADRLTARVLNNKNFKFIQHIINIATTSHIDWLFQYLPALATYVDVPERHVRENHLRDRGLPVPSIEQIYFNSRRVSKLKQELESARVVRDHTLAELNAEHRKVHAMQQQAEAYKRERDIAKTEIQQLKHQVETLSQDKIKTGKDLESLNRKVSELQTQYSAGQRRVFELEGLLSGVRLKLSDALTNTETLKTTIRERADLEKEHDALLITRAELQVKLNLAYDKTREVEDELARSIEEGGRLQQINRELNFASIELRSKLEIAIECLQKLPDAFRLFQLGMTELETVNGGVFGSVQQRFQSESPQLVPVLPVAIHDVEGGIAVSRSGKENVHTSSAGGMFSKKRTAEEAGLKIPKGSELRRNRPQDEEDDNNTAQPTHTVC